MAERHRGMVYAHWTDCSQVNNDSLRTTLSGTQQSSSLAADYVQKGQEKGLFQILNAKLNLEQYSHRSCGVFF